MRIVLSAEWQVLSGWRATSFELAPMPARHSRLATHSALSTQHSALSE
jgi:hypothetical protein